MSSRHYLLITVTLKCKLKVAHKPQQSEWRQQQKLKLSNLHSCASDLAGRWVSIYTHPLLGDFRRRSTSFKSSKIFRIMSLWASAMTVLRSSTTLTALFWLKLTSARHAHQGVSREALVCAGNCLSGDALEPFCLKDRERSTPSNKISK